MENADKERARYKLTLRFVGEALEEPFYPGREGTTVRLGSTYPPGRLTEGDYVRLLAEEVRLVGIARIIGVAYGARFRSLEAVGRLEGERTPYQDPKELVKVLRHLYPEATDETEWTVIGYRTLLSGPWECGES